MFSASLSFLASLALGAVLAQPANAPSNDLPGFGAVLINQINAHVGSERLPGGMGLPAPAGLFTTISGEKVMVYDRLVATLDGGGGLGDAPVAEACQTGCSQALWDGYREMWLQLVEEGAAYGSDLPSRVLMAAASSVPAATLVDAAYAVGETRPKQPPLFYLVLNGGKAGLRVRPFYLVTPGGFTSNAGAQVLGLRLHLDGSGTYKITAADKRFNRELSFDNLQLAREALLDVKKNYPGKRTLILDVSGTATVGDAVKVMVSVQEAFPNIVFTSGGKITAL